MIEDVRLGVGRILTPESGLGMVRGAEKVKNGPYPEYGAAASLLQLSHIADPFQHLIPWQVAGGKLFIRLFQKTLIEAHSSMHS